LKSNVPGYVSGAFKSNCIANSTMLFPLGLCQNVRFMLTLDSLNNVFAPAQDALLEDNATGTVAQPAMVFPTAMTITDFTLSYDSISFPSAVVDTLRMSQSPILIKSQGFSATSQTIPSGTSGIIESVYNSRYASIKNLFLCNGSNSTNGIFDSFNISPRCEYQFNINGTLYPNQSISKQRNHLNELAKATGSAFNSRGNTYAINRTEYDYELGASTTVAEPAKFYTAVSSEVSPFSGNRLLSGVSSENSALSIRYTIDTATPKPINSTLIVNYDLIIQIDPMTRNASIKM
jgi:hypothetical protein